MPWASMVVETTMPTHKALIHIAADHGISGVAPPELPAGDHEAIITIVDRPTRRVADLPIHHGRWDDKISLRREDMYADDGRRRLSSSTPMS